jgi:methylthioribose-1-phosphate isomerase
MNPEPVFQPIEWRGDSVRILDQTLLPQDERYIETDDWRVVADAIRRLAVRGAPLIGIAAGYGVALAARGGDTDEAAAGLLSTRPTAVNLSWAVGRVAGATDSAAEAAAIHEEQVAADVRSGELGARLLSNDATVITHCNTGSLATGGIGSALGVIKTAHRQGRHIRVLVDETRPLLQGSRLTAWELQREGVPYQIIVDGAAAGLIARGAADAVIVGADRIAASGDTANKVGTYGLALAAQAHGIPFYVVAPLSTIDAATPNGNAILIEDRDEAEVLALGGAQVAAAHSTARNPAFDVTPARLITAIVTERGVLRPPFDASIAAVTAREAVAR